MIDYLKQFGEYVETTTGRLSASQMLENYLFPPSIQQMQVSRLSGGEKRKVAIAGVLASNPSVIMFVNAVCLSSGVNSSGFTSESVTDNIQAA